MFFITRTEYFRLTLLQERNYIHVHAYLFGNKSCRDPGSNRGPLDLQSNALPTELSRPFMYFERAKKNISFSYYIKHERVWIRGVPVTYYYRSTGTCATVEKGIDSLPGMCRICFHCFYFY